MAPKEEKAPEVANVKDAEELPVDAAKEEEDAAPSAAATIPQGAAAFHTEDTTVNVLPVAGGSLLSSLSDGGFQYFLAGARASVGLKGGRHMFEVRIAEVRNPSEPSSAARTPTPTPKFQVKVGFSTATAGLLMDGESVSFDSSGYYCHEGARTKAGQRFSTGQVLGVVLNLNQNSPNANTVSLFCDGLRVSEPQPLPLALKGKPLYPAVAYKNALLQVNFGPALRQLPFKCLAVQEAARDDADVAVKSPEPKDGKSEVLFPVGLPDEGTFEWLDQFLSKPANKKYVEISDRAILEWAKKSGIQRNGGYERKTSNDKPEMSFGIPLLDDLSVQRIVYSVAQAIPRHFVVAEVKGNLTPSGRKAGLAKFPSSDFRKVAKVVMGEPPDEHKSLVRQRILDDKKEKLDAAAKAKRAEVERKKKVEEAKKARDEAAKKAKAAREAKERAKAAEGDDDKKEEAVAEQKNEDEEAKEEKEQEETKDEEMSEEAPVTVELTAEEEQMWFFKQATPDLTSKELSAFPQFCLPSAEEGFDDIQFEWQAQGQCEDYLKKWVLEKKLTQRVEDLQPSKWFRDEHAAGSKAISEWKRRQQEHKQPSKKAAGSSKVDGEAADGENAESAKAEDSKNPEEMDVYTIDDVDNIGDGEPLYAKFDAQDWALLVLRFEMHLLVHAFRRDVNDAERTAVLERHASFYFHKYYKKPLNHKYYGCESLADLVDLIKDTMDIDPSNKTLDSLLSEDSPVDNFVRLVEDARRQRQARIDGGDETAALKFQKTVVPPGNPGGKGSYGAPAGGYGPKGSYAGPKGGYSPQPGGYGGKAGAGFGQKRPYPAMPHQSSYPPAKRPNQLGGYGQKGVGYGAAPYGGKGGYGVGPKGYGK